MICNLIERTTVTKVDVSTSFIEKKEDFIAKDVPLQIFLNSSHLVTLQSSPFQLKELVFGYLISEGIVDSIDAITELSFKENRCDVTLQKFNTRKEKLDENRLKHPVSLRVKASIIYNKVNILNTLARTFKQTGGVHVAALFNKDGQLVILAEDVGRYNAVDKVIGAVTLKGKDLGCCFLAFSGRMTGEIVLKAARVGIPIIASLGAPIDSGFKVAEKTGMTLIGFIRKGKMNIYTCQERIAI